MHNPCQKFSSIYSNISIGWITSTPPPPNNVHVNRVNTQHMHHLLAGTVILKDIKIRSNTVLRGRG